MIVCLDAWALLAWIQDEPAASAVDTLLGAEGGERLMSTVNLGEVYYRMMRVTGEDAARALWSDVVSGKVPITLVEATARRVRRAASLKARFPISYADAFAMATAIERNVPLATGDREIHAVHGQARLELIWLGEEDPPDEG